MTCTCSDPAFRRFRFSLQASGAASKGEWLDLARRAEDAGYDLFVTPDHLGGPFGPLVALSLAAEATTRLRVGTLVLNNDFYHPVLLARDVATLDLLSDGRAELGLGAGHAGPEYDAAGIPFDPPARRIERLGESVAILRRLFDGETLSHRGPYYRLEGARCDPNPVQSHLPVLIGGGGNRVLCLAARHADSVGFTGLGRTLEDGQHHEPSGFPPERVDEQVRAVRAAAGESWGQLELQVLVQAVLITEDRETAAASVQRRISGVSTDDLLATPYLMVGAVQQLTETLLEQRERWGFSHYTVRAESLDAFAPVVAALEDQ